MSNTEFETLRKYFVESYWICNDERNTRRFSINGLSITIFENKYQPNKYSYVVNDVFSRNVCNSTSEAKYAIFQDIYSDDITREILTKWYSLFNSGIQESKFDKERATGDVRNVLRFIISLNIDPDWRVVEFYGLQLLLGQRELIVDFIGKIIFKYSIKHRDVMIRGLNKRIPNIMRACHIR